MAQSYEEKLEALKNFDGWLDFTDPQRVFLAAMAEGLTPTNSFKRAYPDTKGTSVPVALGAMMTRVGIKRALEAIGIVNKVALVTKDEAKELLSKHLRKTDDPTVVVKLLSVYGKISGWEETDEPPTEEVSLDKLVAAVEKKRKVPHEQVS